jgi:hypothetical protein
VAAFVAEPIVGATLAAAEPPDRYWDAITAVLRRHGVLLITDEVMTGFGRTGSWFGGDHWDVRPDILVAAKGATSGYWPFGFVAAAGPVAEVLEAPGSFVHGFTYSHHPVGAAVASEVLRILEDEDLVHASEVKGARLRRRWRCGSRITCTWARSAGAASWWVRAGRRARDASAVPTRRPCDRAGGGRGTRRGRAGLLGDRQCQRGSMATRSCSARRSSSRTQSSSGVIDVVSTAITTDGGAT